MGGGGCEWTRKCQRQSEAGERAKSVNMTCWNKAGEGGLRNGHAARLRSRADALGR